MNVQKLSEKLSPLWLGYAVIGVSLNISRIATRLNRIDLLDHSALAPFTQLGLTNSLVMIGSFSIWSLMSLEAGFGQVMLFIGVATLISRSFALLLPVRGVHTRIRQSNTNCILEYRHGRRGVYRPGPVLI